MSAQHTEGPWQVMMAHDKFGRTVYHVNCHTHTMVAVEHDGSFWPLAHNPETDDDGYYLPDDEMDCASFRVPVAHLIAAAPELLEALETLLDASERHIFGDECLAERDAARAVIAKARGAA